MRFIAGMEAFKGLIAIAAGLGLLSLAHHDLHRLAATLIGHIGLDPGGRYPAWLLGEVDALQRTSLPALLATVVAYACIRFAEAYGLWRERPWGEWLGALSGAIYVPFELRHWLHRPDAVATAVIVCNLAVVAFLAWRLRRRPSA